MIDTIYFDADRPEAAGHLANAFHELLSICEHRCDVFRSTLTEQSFVVLRQQKPVDGKLLEAQIEYRGFSVTGNRAVNALTDDATTITLLGAQPDYDDTMRYEKTTETWPTPTAAER